MAVRLYDEEFSAAALQMLKKREILGQSNPVHLAVLDNNVGEEVEVLEQRFDAERRENPLLETTCPEAWLVAEFIPIVRAIRANVEIGDSILAAALKRHFQRAVPPTTNGASGEQQLWTTIEPYGTALKKLLLDLYDRRKSLHGILQFRKGVRTIRAATSAVKPTSRREAIILDAISKRRPNQTIALELDRLGLHPRTDKSYAEMLRVNPQGFYALKSHIKRKYAG